MPESPTDTHVIPQTVASPPPEVFRRFPPRFFNTAGPCRPGEHFLIPAERRLKQVRALIDRQAYFVLHAARQTGKTTYIQGLARALNAEGRYTALAINLETLQHVKDPTEANRAILHILSRDAGYLLPSAECPPRLDLEAGESSQGVQDQLTLWAASNPKPIVLLIDEIDALQGDVLISVLRQLRAGYIARPNPFPQCIMLVGLRDVRDYRIKLRDETESLGQISPFNIKLESLTLRNFTRDEVEELYVQHTDDTGQVFEKAACDLAFELTQGQPWLVNALAYQAVDYLVTDRTQPITPETILKASENLIQRRDTHLDHLLDKLRQPRVRRIMAPLLAGETIQLDELDDDVRYLRDLGLLAEGYPLRLANPIYQEIVPRVVSHMVQENIQEQPAWYITPTGGLDVRKLLTDFQSFYRENAEAWLKHYDYVEAGPHLILQAWLQRLVNGGGRIRREFAVGSRRVDLLIEWKQERHALELKVKRDERSKKQGLEQLGAYLDRLGLSTGYLVLFDPDFSKRWHYKLTWKKATTPQGHEVWIVGC